MKGLRIAGLLIVMVALSGCGTSAIRQYYKFSGVVIDKETGAPIPNAAIFIAEAKNDFFEGPRYYSDMTSDRTALSMARTVFRGDATNGYLYFRADDEGRFTTVWRTDQLEQKVFPVLLFVRPRLKTIAFVAGAPGYGNTVTEFRTTAGGHKFKGDPELLGLGTNDLPPIALEGGSSPRLDFTPIEIRYLVRREPVATRDPELRKLIADAESAFFAKRYDDAIMHARTALALRENEPVAWMILIDSHFFRGEHKSVLSEGGKYVEQHPEYALIHKIMARSALALGRMDLYRALLLSGQQIDPEKPHMFHPDLMALDPSLVQQPAGWPPIQSIYAGGRAN